jgi:hypothetical protein
LISLEIQGIFIPPDQQTSSPSRTKKWGHVKEGPCERDPVTLDGSGWKWKVVTPLERTNWAGAMCKSQNTLEVVLSVFNSGFRKQINI